MCENMDTAASAMDITQLHDQSDQSLGSNLAEGGSMDKRDCQRQQTTFQAEGQSTTGSEMEVQPESINLKMVYQMFQSLQRQVDKIEQNTSVPTPR